MVKAPVAFVHLAYGFSPDRWATRWKTGELIGINDPLPYGYSKAEELGFHVKYSESSPEKKVCRFIRLGLRYVLGFDFVHVWRNRIQILESDVVWTHTESQSLAVAALLRLTPHRRRPRTILQNVWLMDRWDTFSFVKRATYHWLLSSADILSFLSVVNTSAARRLFPKMRVEHVRFGIRTEELTVRPVEPTRKPIHVLSLGNDKDRDWSTLRNALQGDDAFDVKVVTRSVPKNYFSGNAVAIEVKHNNELLALYKWADMVIVPLKSNLHASGITVIQEATTQSVPVICTNVGGLDDYFDFEEVYFVQEKDAAGIKEAVLALAGDAERRFRMVRKAQRRMMVGGLNSHAYAVAHAKLSLELLRKYDERF